MVVVHGGDSEKVKFSVGNYNFIVVIPLVAILRVTTEEEVERACGCRGIMFLGVDLRYIDCGLRRIKCYFRRSIKFRKRVSFTISAKVIFNYYAHIAKCFWNRFLGPLWLSSAQFIALGLQRPATTADHSLPISIESGINKICAARK